MDNERDVMEVCKNCGKPVEKGELYCSQCMIEHAEEHIPEIEEALTSEGPKESRFPLMVKWAVLLISLIIVAIQMPKLLASFEEAQPVRQGTYSTDSETDQCITNLWQISKRLQEGKPVGTDIVCPASKKPYIVEGTGKTLTVRCPNPELHGFSLIRVSRNNPIPEVKK